MNLDEFTTLMGAEVLHDIESSADPRSLVGDLQARRSACVEAFREAWQGWSVSATDPSRLP